jgi:hypothetical protein
VASPEEIQQAVEAAAKRRAVPSALRLHLDALGLPGNVLGELKELLAGFPGESEVLIKLTTPGGPRHLKLGPEFRVTRSAALHAELVELLGEAMLGEGASANATAVPPEDEATAVVAQNGAATAEGPAGGAEAAAASDGAAPDASGSAAEAAAATA